MGIFKNLLNKLKVAKKNADEATTDYVANAEVGLEDGKKMLTNMEEQLFGLRSTSKVNESKLTQAEAQVEKVNDLIQRKAKAAAGAKGEALAKHKDDLTMLVEEQKNAKIAYDEAKSQVDTDRRSVSSIMAKRDEVKGKLRRGESKLATKKAELVTAKVTQQMNQGFKTFESNDPMAALDALDDHVEKEKASADVAEEMSGEQTERTLDRIEQEMSGDGTSVDDEVAALIASASEEPVSTKKRKK